MMKRKKLKIVKVKLIDIREDIAALAIRIEKLSMEVKSALYRGDAQVVAALAIRIEKLSMEVKSALYRGDAQVEDGPAPQRVEKGPESIEP